MKPNRAAGLGLALVLLAFPALALAQPGVHLPGAGATHGGMAGVSTATPIDALGAIYWNPAAIGRLGRNEVSIGGSLVYPEIYVSSSRPRLDGTVESGRTRSDNGFPLIPSLGIVSKLDEESPMTFGMGLIALGGGGVNFPGDVSNPVLAPTGPFGQVVLGPTFATMQLLQVNPTVSYQVNDKLVVGVGPTVDITSVSFDPAYFAPPNQIAGLPNTFLPATDSRPFWGVGGRAGLVYSVTETLDIGFSYTSEQWLETWEFNSRDNLGNPRTLTLKASLPAIYSWGAAWRGIEGLTLGLDMRYFDYESTDLFGTPTSEGGLGWDSVFAVALGGNYQWNDRVAVRAGYQYNNNPLENSRALFNIQSPAVIEHTVTVGATVALTDAMSMSFGYAYGFNNSVSGAVERLPNTSIELETSSHSLLFNTQIKFGGAWGPKAPCGPACDVLLPGAAPLASAAGMQPQAALGMPK